MTATEPFSKPREYVKEHRDDLVFLIRNGDSTVRALALAVLIEGGGRASLETIERELQLAKQLTDEEREKVWQ
jgi:hypothetical protein